MYWCRMRKYYPIKFYFQESPLSSVCNSHEMHFQLLFKIFHYFLHIFLLFVLFKFVWQFVLHFFSFFDLQLKVFHFPGKYETKPYIVAEIFQTFSIKGFVGVCNCSMFCCMLLYVHSSIAIILMGKRELIALLNLSSWCLVMVERLFLAVPRGCLQFVIVVFPDHTHYFRSLNLSKHIWKYLYTLL